jgi:putative DNA primase/helicase
MDEGSPMSTAACVAALAALESEISPLPVRADGSKAPALTKWKWLQIQRPTPAQVESWYRREPAAGVAVIGGKVSENAEFLDFDEHVIFEDFQLRAVEHGLGALVERISGGWRELSPNGAHLAYRCARIEGNTKLAQRLKRPEEMDDADDRVKTLIETRGEGGYLIVAPSGGRVHPSGRPYGPMMGSFATIATITPEEREALLELCRTFDLLPRTSVYGGKPSTATTSAGGERPGDAFNARASWADVLGTKGWTKLFDRDDLTYWRRPGKKDRGWSATTGARGSDGGDLLYVFSTNTVFDSEKGYSKFGAYALLEHGGDFSAAARALAARGYGTRSAPDTTAGRSAKSGRVPDPISETPRQEAMREGVVATASANGTVQPTTLDDWPEPDAIDGPGPAPALPLDCFPRQLVEHAEDLAERMQCPIDYVVWTLMVTLATLIGRTVGIRPKRLDDWTERPALWVALVGDPSSMKTPGMNAGVRLLHALNHQLREAYRVAVDNWRAACAEARQADPKHPDLPAEPSLHWLVVDDATTENWRCCYSRRSVAGWSSCATK